MKEVYEPERIISIVSPSRSGSTVIKHALSLHPGVCSLAGEEEPYYKLTHNGYPWHSSDRFDTANNPDIIRMLISAELLNDPATRLEKRQYLQDMHIEETPFVDISKHEYRVTPILMLKTPQNCYRRGVINQLWPNARVDYIRIYRDPRAIVNGLIDGWETPGAFEARWIKEVADWWKFDMPPFWDQYLHKSSEEKAIFQCASAIAHLDTEYPDAVNVRFEDFCTDWAGTTNAIWEKLDLPQADVLANITLPVLMATDAPVPERWRTKRPHLEGLKI